MAQRGTQPQTTPATDRVAIRGPEARPAAKRASAGNNTLLLSLQGDLGNRATAGLLRSVGVLQPSLRIGAAADPYEREADRIGDRMMQGGPGAEVAAAAPAAASPPALQRLRLCSDCEEELRRAPLPAPAISEIRVQRACAECEAERDGEFLRRAANGGDGAPASPALASRVVSLRGRGAPLSPAQRGFFEPRFGPDFSGVRLHTGAAAADAARLARARAFTVGRDIAFGAGEFRPESRSGRRLLAHELTHVVQQTPLVARRKPLVQRQPAPAGGAGSPAPEPALPEPLQEEQPAPAGPESEEAVPEQTPAPGLLVEDDAATLGAGQMTRSAFLAETRAAVCAAADAALAGTEFTAQGCPYVELVLRFYERQSAERIESDLVSYLPDAAGVASASAYIPFIVNRVRQSVETFVATGEITGIPEGVPSSLTSLVEAASSTGGLLFKARDGGPKGSPDPRAVQAQLGRGRPLAGSVRSRMQSAFGRSFSGVRVHTGATASRLSDRLNARAFTVGNHVAFGTAEYRPGTPVGDALVAHELAHVVQQRGARDSVASMGAGIGATSTLERDADRSAAGVVASLWRGMNGSVSSIARNAVPSLRSGLRLQRCPAAPKAEKRVDIFTVSLPGATRDAATDAARANEIWSQCSVKVNLSGGQSWATAVLDKLPPTGVLNEFSTPTSPTQEELDLLDHHPGGKGTIHAYFVPAMSAGSRGENFRRSTTPNGVRAVIVSNSAAEDTFAHELGHVLLDDGSHHNDPDNLMATGSIRNVGVDKLDATQCSKA